MSKVNQMKILKKDDVHEIIHPDHELLDDLSPGFYRVFSAGPLSSKYYFCDEEDEILLPPNAFQMTHTIFNVEEIKQFFSDGPRKIYEGMNMIHKLAYILKGPQGTGKTTAVYALAQHLIDTKDAVVITVGSMGSMNYACNFMKTLQKHDKDHMTVIIFDEFEDVLEGQEASLKSLLDSYNSPSNTLFLFMTNYIEKVPETITDRPSRIKEVIHVGKLTDSDIIFSIFESMNNNVSDEVKISDQGLRDMVQLAIGEKGEGSSIDEVKHLYLDSALQMNLKREEGIKGLMEVIKAPKMEEDHKLGKKKKNLKVKDLKGKKGGKK